MAAESTARATWEGDLARGSGKVRGTSGALAEVEVSWASRTERTAGTTSPEELIAAAHAACFCMALSHELGEAGHAPEHLDVSATVVFEPGVGITTSRLQVRGRVAGIDTDAFAEAAGNAGQNCPVSAALRGNVTIEVDATLEQ